MLKLDKTIDWKILRTQKFKNIKTLNFSDFQQAQVIMFKNTNAFNAYYGKFDIYKEDLKQHSNKILMNSRILIHSFFKNNIMHFVDQ